METALHHFTPLRESRSGRSLRSEPGQGGRRVYKGVTIIKAGLGNKRDRNYYPAETLEAAVRSGYFEGLRAYADHPDALAEEVQPERTIRDMVGVYTHPKFLREGKGGGRVVADLNLFRSSKWLSDTVDDLIELGQADKIGLSINGRGRTVERQIQLEEADPVNVNWVEDFSVLRSADVVTEAGAGGGFQQLLESARGTAQVKENEMKLTEQQKTAMKTAVDAGDLDKVQELLRECGCTGAAAAAPKKAAKPARAAAAPAQEADDEETVTDDEAEVDPLDAAHAEVTQEADEAVEEPEPAEDVDDVADEDLDESGDDEDDEDVDDEPAEEARTREARGTGLKGGAGVIVRGGGKGKHGGKIKGPGGAVTVKPASAIRGSQKGGQKGRKFGESDVAYLRRLEAQNEQLREDNARKSAQLKIRTTADRARNLLRESSVPRKIQPDVLRLMVGKSEDEMRRIVAYHERLIEAAASFEYDDDTAPARGRGRVEGNGSRLRESFHGSGEGDMGDLLADVGLPTRDS